MEYRPGLMARCILRNDDVIAQRAMACVGATAARGARNKSSVEGGNIIIVYSNATINPPASGHWLAGSAARDQIVHDLYRWGRDPSMRHPLWSQYCCMGEIQGQDPGTR